MGGVVLFGDSSKKKFHFQNVQDIMQLPLSHSHPSSLLALNHTLVQPVDVLTVLQTEM